MFQVEYDFITSNLNVTVIEAKVYDTLHYIWFDHETFFATNELIKYPPRIKLDNPVSEFSFVLVLLLIMRRVECWSVT